MRDAPAMAVGAFLAVVSRHLLAGASVPPPRGATSDSEGRWVLGDVLLTDRGSLGRALGVPIGERDEDLVLAAIAHRGVRAAEWLHGEYAFVAWDAPRRTLLAARDGLGHRLLYAAVTSDAMGFGDDPARLAALPGVDASLDRGVLAAFLADTVDEDLTRTVYRGVRAIPAGHTVSWSGDATEADSRRHWEFPSPPTMNRRDARDLPAMFSTVLDTAVGERLRGPTASILLSGGIDSGSIAAAAQRARPDVALRAFTATYEPLIPDLELSWTRRVAAHLGLPLEVVRCAEKPALAPGSALGMPQPLDEPTWPEWRRLVHAAAQWSETTLYGQDGDALLLPATLREMQRVEPWPQLAAGIIAYAARHGRLPYLGTGLRRIFGAPVLERAAPSPPWLRVPPDTQSALAPFVVVSAPARAQRDWPRRRLTTGYWQSLVRAYSPAWTGARTAFRLPLLDDRMLALAMAAPSVPWMQRKELMRAAASQSLPGDVARRPKTTIARHHPALVAQWRAQWDGRVTVAEELHDWVNVPILERVLRDGPDLAVSDAWRALELSAWLEARRAAQGMT